MSTQVWFIETRARSHVCNSREMFLEYTPNYLGQVVADARVAGRGTVVLKLAPSNEDVVLYNVLHVPSSNNCVISVTQLCDENRYRVAFEGDNVEIIDDERLIGNGQREGEGKHRLNVV